MTRAALWIVLFGCAATSAPPEQPMSSQRLELVEGTPVTLADGTIVDIKGVGYLHLPDSKNLSSCTLVLRRGDKGEDLALAREHGGSDPESSGYAMGWQFTLEVANPYSRPSRAVILAVPRHTGQ